MAAQPAPGRLRRLGRAVALGTGTALVVAALGYLVRVRVDPLIELDDRAIRRATDLTRAHDGLRQALLGWQWAFQPLRVYVVATPVCLWVWLRHGLRTRALWAFATMMVGWNLALVTKYLVQRARPLVADPVSQAPGYSYPSGHVANVTIACTALVVLLWPVLGRAGRVATVAGSVVLVSVTALDRVLLGVHYPTDTVGGVLLGVGLVLASYAGYRGWHPPLRKDPL